MTPGSVWFAWHQYDDYMMPDLYDTDMMPSSMIGYDTDMMPDQYDTGMMRDQYDVYDSNMIFLWRLAIWLRMIIMTFFRYDPIYDEKWRLWRHEKYDNQIMSHCLA